MERVTTPTKSSGAVLGLALELSAAQWKLAFSPGLGQSPRMRTIAAGDLEGLVREIEAAKRRFGLPEATRVASCYEAGRDGFWLHRALGERGVENQVVDSASIEVNRRAKRRKTDRLDAQRLVTMLLRYLGGEERVWSVVRVPSEEEEDRRQLHRELKAAKADQRRLVCRIRSLLVTQGIGVSTLEDLPGQLAKLRGPDGRPVPPRLKERLAREWKRLLFARTQLLELKKLRRELLRTAQDAATRCAKKLMAVRSVGEESSWLLATEFFSWRTFQNGRQVGALAGLAATPWQSGEVARDLGISKAGNPAVRHMMVELAWSWLRFQPESELSRWYQERFGQGTGRRKRIGIVAVARKLLIALWRYLETGVPPAGARMK